MSKWIGRAGWGHYECICFYCRAAVLAALPTMCWHCGCELSAEITPKMKIRNLSDLCFKNGRRLVINAVHTS